MNILIRPNADSQYGALNQFRAKEPPLWLAMWVNKFKDASIVDLEVQEGVSVNRKDKIYILATGNHPSSHYQQKAEALKIGGMVGNATIYDHLPFDPLKSGPPRFEKLPMASYRCHNWHGWGRADRKYGITFSSISCPYSCSFCTIKDFYRCGYKQRHPSLVVRDIITQLSRYGISNFKMMDELFAVKNKHTRDICEALEPIGDIINIWSYARIDTVDEKLLNMLRKAGVRWLAYGIEVGDEEQRAKIGKNVSNNRIRDIIKMTHDAGISVVGNYIFGYKDDKKTYELAKELNCEYANFYVLVDYHKDKEVAQYKLNNKVTSFRDRAFNDYFSDSRYLSMVRKKFGQNVVEEIGAMTSVKLQRA